MVQLLKKKARCKNCNNVWKAKNPTRCTNCGSSDIKTSRAPRI